MFTRCILRYTINCRSAASAATIGMCTTADFTAAVTMLRRYPLGRGFVSASLPLYEKKVIAVPTMGDSITEVIMLLCFSMVLPKKPTARCDDVRCMI